MFRELHVRQNALQHPIQRPRPRPRDDLRLVGAEHALVPGLMVLHPLALGTPSPAGDGGLPRGLDLIVPVRCQRAGDPIRMRLGLRRLR